LTLRERSSGVGPLTVASISRWTTDRSGARPNSGATGRVSRIAGTAYAGTAAYTSTFRMPVVWYVVETPPHGTVTVGFVPTSKSTCRRLHAAGTSLIRPSTLIAPARENPSTMAFSVPGENVPIPSMANAIRSADGSRSARWAARQSVAVTSNPTPGNRLVPTSVASRSLAAASSRLSMSPAMSR